MKNRNEGTSGRLYFYPTFFTETSLEVINPHDRERRVGKNPILIESVPTGAQGTFTLLYTPLDRITETRQQTCADLQRVAEGLEALFTRYGFGAKTSSGFGLADNAVESGRLVLKLPEVTLSQSDAPQVQKPDDAFLKYLDEAGQVHSAFAGNGEGGLMSNSEYKQTSEQHGGGSLSEFKRFRGWYVEHNTQWQASLQSKAAETDYPESPFDSLSQLTTLCQSLQADPDATQGGDA